MFVDRGVDEVMRASMDGLAVCNELDQMVL